MDQYKWLFNNIGNMKKLIFFLFFLPVTILSQSSWVNVIVQADNYGGETSWEIYEDSTIVAISGAYANNSYNEIFVTLPPGGYNFVIYDQFGDGICCDWGEGYFGLVNNCGLNTFVYDFNSPTATVYFDLLACPPPVIGCMEAEALNFNPWANSPAPCTFPPAACASGQTNIISLITPDSYPNETSWQITVNGDTLISGGYEGTTGVTIPTYTCVNEGDTLVATIYDTYGDGMCGTCWGGVDGYFNVLTLCGDSIFTVGGETQFDTISSNPYIVPVCAPVSFQGCTTPGYVEYNPLAVTDDGSCNTLVTLGCTDITMFNYDVLANTMDVHPSCDYTLTITDGGADGWFGSWLGMTQGDSVYGPYSMGVNDGYEEDFNLTLNSNEEISVYFFTEGNAETTASQCGFRIEGPNGTVLQSGTNPWTDPLKKFPYKYTETPTCSNYCEVFVYGCMDIEAQNYDVDANAEDNTCYFFAGCTQAGYVEYYNQGYVADYDNGSCNELALFGCMDELALNYDSEANVDTGDCIEVVVDCTDPNAVNYNELANSPSNELCLYDAGCIGEPGTPYYLNDSCYAWIITIDPYCCEVEWDNACIDLYSYCEQGWPTGVPEANNGFDVYPNPVSDVLNIQTSQNVLTEVYNAFGQIVIPSTRDKRINLTHLPKGLYEVVVNYNGRILIKKIIKS